MIAIVVGKQRWRRRRAVARMGVAAVDDFGRPGFAYLTDTHRKRRQVARDITGRSPDVFEPAGWVLADLLVELWQRWGDGRAVLSDRVVALHGARVVEADHRLAALGSPEVVGRQLARLTEALGQARSTAPLRPEVADGVHALLRRCTTDRAVMQHTAIEALLPRLRRPEPGLRRWLATQPPIVIDDILQPTPLRTEALVTLIEAFDTAGTDVILAFECGRARNAADLAASFGAAEPDPLAHKAFAATRALRQVVFERFVATGAAELVLATADGPVPVDPATEPPAEPSDLADLAFADVEPPLDPRVSVWACASPVDEAERVAEEVRAALDAGADPADCLVATADPDGAALIARALQRYGVPVDAAEGTRLATTPPGQLALLLARLGAEPFAPSDWLALGDLAGLALDGVLAALQAAGIRGGPPERWIGPIKGWAARVGAPFDALVERITALGALAGALSLDTPRTPSEWGDAWRASATRCGLDALTERSDTARRARAALDAVLDALVDDLAAVDPGPWAPAEAGAHLQAAIRSATLPSPRGGVALTGLLELRGLTPPHIWVLGLTRSHWPAPSATSPLVDAATARRLAPVDRLAEARYLLGSLLRNATGDPNARSLALSWPTTIDGQPTTCSRVLVELLARPLGDGTLRDALVQTVIAAPPEPGPAARVGMLGTLPHPAPPPGRISVTAAETALKCPARYWYQHVLRLDPHDPWDPELEPRRRGTAIHDILQRFYEGRGLRAVDPAERAAARASLHAVASAVLDEVESAGGFEPALQAWARDRWLAGLLDDRPLGVLGAWLENEIAEGIAPVAVETPIALPLPGGELSLRGTIDRVDRGPGGALRVTDYKTGQPPTRARMEAGLSLQPLAYVEAVRRGAEGAPVASTFQTLARADGVRSSGWYGDPDAMAAFGATRGTAVDAAEREERLADVERRLRAVLYGDIPTTRWGEALAGCDTCDFRTICRVRHDEGAEEAPC
ncbi:MAG: PD-(D/E)XK nuclease family protein [Alphaproteobacteria bacterium]|nr:PD-(D/E)XK nuclease family protein [Alphaproteobacteria bacterium]